MFSRFMNLATQQCRPKMNCVCMLLIGFLFSGSITMAAPIGMTHAEPFQLTAQEKQWLEEHRDIQIGIMADWPPMDFVAANGEAQRIGVDFIKAINTQLGTNFKIAPGPWEEIYEKTKAGQLDALMDITPREERMVFFNFTRPYTNIPHVIVGRNDETYFSKISDLEGKKVSLEKGYFLVRHIRENFSNISVEEYETTGDALDAVIKGETDAYIGNRAVVYHLMVNELISNLKIMGKIKETSSLNSIGVRKDWPEFATILDKALAAIPKETRHKILLKWSDSGESKKEKIDLTAKEIDWLKRHPVIKVHNERAWAPFNFNSNDEPLGYSIDYMNLVAENLGLQIEYLSGPSWNEFMEMVQDGRIDVMLNIVSSEKRREFLDFTSPYLDVAFGIYSHQDNTDIHRLEDLLGKKIAIPGGFITEEVLSRFYPEVILVKKKNLQECLEAVAIGEVDATISGVGSTNHLLQKLFLSNVKLAAQIKNNKHFSNQMAIGVHKSQSLLRDILQKGMDKISYEEIRVLNEKWITPAAERKATDFELTDGEKIFYEDVDEIKMCVNPDWGPLSSIDQNGQLSGFAADLIDLMRKDISVPIRLVKTESWSQTLDFARQRKCDIVPNIVKTDERSKYLAFTAPYLSVPLLIATSEDVKFIDDLQRLDGKKIGMIKSYALFNQLRVKYPSIEFIEVENNRVGLEKVQSGEHYGYIDSLATLAAMIEKYGMLNLKISGRLDEEWHLSIGVRNDWFPLLTTFNRLLTKVGPETIANIYQDKIAVKFVQEFNYQKYLKYLVVLLVVVGLIVYRNFMLKKYNSKLEKLSITDRLTGAFNRNHLETVMNIELQRVARHGQDLSLIMVDIDHFKSINDNFGHLIGDKVLVKVVDVLKEGLRDTDTLGRWGGEEFMIICSASSQESAKNVAERLCKSIEAQMFSHKKTVTASFGIATFREGDDENAIINRADKALYQAKENGRNQVVVS